jgi:hypothetical protein
MNGLEDFLNKFRGKRSDSIANYEFKRCDIQREDVVREVLDIYSGDLPPYFKRNEEYPSSTEEDDGLDLYIDDNEEKIV